jgi:hypothetical protein
VPVWQLNNGCVTLIDAFISKMITDARCGPSRMYWCTAVHQFHTCIAIKKVDAGSQRPGTGLTRAGDGTLDVRVQPILRGQRPSLSLAVDPWMSFSQGWEHIPSQRSHPQPAIHFLIAITTYLLRMLGRLCGSMCSRAR